MNAWSSFLYGLSAIIRDEDAQAAAIASQANDRGAGRNCRSQDSASSLLASALVLIRQEVCHRRSRFFL